ncbi:MAG TPA: hypothetical protein VEC12_08600 [Bacteroidia bacterium]|nr:hypothetical protein [Bacteroidia bacterium]
MSLIESEAWKQFAALEKEKRKSVKYGEDVIHLDYFSPIISNEELKNFDEQLSKVGLRFSSYDKSGQMTASLEDFALLSAIALNDTTVKAILDNTLSTLAWETIKFITLNLYRKMRGKVITKYTHNTSEEKPMTFGMNASLDENTAYSFKLDGSEETVLKGMDKILDFLREQKPNSHYKFPHLTTYNEQAEDWQSLDVEDEIRKMVKERKKN